MDQRGYFDGADLWRRNIRVSHKEPCRHRRLLSSPRSAQIRRGGSDPYRPVASRIGKGRNAYRPVRPNDFRSRPVERLDSGDEQSQRVFACAWSAGRRLGVAICGGVPAPLEWKSGTRSVAPDQPCAQIQDIRTPRHGVDLGLDALSHSPRHRIRCAIEMKLYRVHARKPKIWRSGLYRSSPRRRSVPGARMACIRPVRSLECAGSLCLRP